MNHRIRVNEKILINLRNELINEVKNELGVNQVQDSIIVNVALIKYICLRDNRGVDLKLKKNGQIKFKFI